MQLRAISGTMAQMPIAALSLPCTGFNKKTIHLSRETERHYFISIFHLCSAFCYYRCQETAFLLLLVKGYYIKMFWCEVFNSSKS